MIRAPGDGTRRHIPARPGEPGAGPGATAEAVAGRSGTTRPVALTRLRPLRAVGPLRTGGAGHPYHRCHEARIAGDARTAGRGG
ncbi:ArsR family transcriptional regulator [Streptomyces sp. NEAU-W12]|uniref:ArsR family transcriptional regulator n=1 Tax=Streptomyces sp. NEAU-W12 TaxID=2994668 RepID=UPI00224ACA05|nr:ArsR family transcriptional regulator [Streptomyces sp. NEAU-W12]MCX2924167.1 ArsR family transcriptional regulator [Streptomyces sp. NEAU-W12]